MARYAASSDSASTISSFSHPCKPSWHCPRPSNECHSILEFQVCTHIGDALAALLFVLHAGKRVIIWGHIGQDRFLVRSCWINVLRIEQTAKQKHISILDNMIRRYSPWYAQFVGCRIEGMVQIIQIGVLWVDNRAIFEQIGAMGVYERIETQTGTPGGCKVLYIDTRIAVRLALTPQKECIFGWTFLAGFVFLILKKTEKIS